MRGEGRAGAAAAESSAPARRCHAAATALQAHELGVPCVDASSVGAMAEARSGSLALTDSDANSAVVTAAGRLVSMVHGGGTGGRGVGGRRRATCQRVIILGRFAVQTLPRW